MPSSVLFPTPLPPNTPIRCPRPQVRIASMARTPVPIAAGDGLAGNGVERLWPELSVGARRRRAPVRRSGGRDRRSRGRAARRRPGSVRALPFDTIGSPGRMPAVSPSGTDSSRPSRKPTTSTGSGAPRPVRTSQMSPTLAAGPYGLDEQADDPRDLPMTGAGSIVRNPSQVAIERDGPLTRGRRCHRLPSSSSAASSPSRDRDSSRICAVDARRRSCRRPSAPGIRRAGTLASATTSTALPGSGARRSAAAS